jgi:hypothetical protein
MKKKVRQLINNNMIYKDTEQLSNIYAGISKQAIPSQDQLVQQAPVLSRTDLSKDQDDIANIYANLITEAKEPCCPCTIGKKCTKKGCECTACKKSLKESQILEAKKEAPKKGAKPDYLDVDEDGDDKESMKKALKDKAMKESSKFKNLFMSIINEAEVCGCSIKKGSQYNCVMKDGTKKVLKGESVLMMKDKLKSVKAAHQE